MLNSGLNLECSQLLHFVEACELFLLPGLRILTPGELTFPLLAIKLRVPIGLCLGRALTERASEPLYF